MLMLLFLFFFSSSFLLLLHIAILNHTRTQEKKIVNIVVDSL